MRGAKEACVAKAVAQGGNLPFLPFLRGASDARRTRDGPDWQVECPGAERLKCLPKDAVAKSVGGEIAAPWAALDVVGGTALSTPSSILGRKEGHWFEIDVGSSAFAVAWATRWARRPRHLT